MAEELAFQVENEVSDVERRAARMPHGYSMPSGVSSSVRRRSSGTGEQAALSKLAELDENGCSCGADKDSHTSGYAIGVTMGGTDGIAARRAPPVQWDGSRLYWFDECPPQLQYNCFVRSGYRAGMSYAQCLCSIFSYHNETGNILTHLLPALLITASLLTGWLPAWPNFAFGFYSNLLPILVCLFGSVSYHTFMAHHWKYKQWLMLDVCGIFVLFLGGVHIVLWWGLRCFPRIRLAYTIAYYSLAAIAVISAVRAKSALTRALPMLLLFLVRVSLMGVRWYLEAASVCATRHYIAMEVWSVLGGSINAARVPERWFSHHKRDQGRFDTWLNSHNIMHIFVVAAMAHLFRGATLDFEQFIAQGAPCPA